METLVKARRAQRIVNAKLRRVASMANDVNLGSDLPTCIRRYHSKAEFMASIRAAMDKADRDD